MPYELRTEEDVRSDILAAFLASQSRVTDLNAGSILRTLFEESLAPEIAQLYFALLETMNMWYVGKAEGEDLDARVGDFGLTRLPARKASGYARMFGLIKTSGNVTTAGVNTLSDTSKTWTVNAYVNHAVRITEGRGKNQVLWVTSNTANQLTLSTNWSVIPNTSSVYELYAPAAADTPIPDGTVVYATNAAGDRVEFVTVGTPALEDADTSTAGTDTILTCAGKVWGVDTYVACSLVITTGPLTGNVRTILTNTDDTITVSTPFSGAIGVGTGFRIYRATIYGGTVGTLVPIEASLAGDTGNVPGGAVNAILSSVAGVEGVYNCSIYSTAEAATSGGRDIESDDALRARFHLFLQSLTRGTVDALRYGALIYQDPTTGDYPVHSAYLDEGIGSNILYIEDGSGTASVALVAAVQDWIDGDITEGREGWRGGGIPTTVTSGNLLSVDVTVSLTLATGASLTTTRNAVDEQIRAYFNRLGLGDDVSFAQLVRLCYDTDGVNNILLTAPAADVAVAADEKAIIGTLTIL